LFREKGENLNVFRPKRNDCSTPKKKFQRRRKSEGGGKREFLPIEGKKKKPGSGGKTCGKKNAPRKGGGPNVKRIIKEAKP